MTLKPDFKTMENKPDSAIVAIAAVVSGITGDALHQVSYVAAIHPYLFKNV